MYKLMPYTASFLLLICVAKYTTATQFHVSMDEDLHYLLDWSYNNDDSTMTFTIRVKTTGWVGFGISPYTGKMPGSDIVIGWVDNNGKAYLQVISTVIQRFLRYIISCVMINSWYKSILCC